MSPANGISTATMPAYGRLTFYSCFLIAALLLLGGTELRGVDAAAVMSVDLGAEWLKVGVVSPGVPMEIALNRESKRKTPAILAFRDGVRTFGEDAVTVGIRDPAAAYGYLLDLLGKTIDNPIVELYRKRFPYYELIGDPERRTIIFKKSETEQFSVEELIAQILVKAKEYAQESTSQPITECVLTVPGYFAQAEREAILAAAQLANLKVLQLINDYTAVALNYGVFHRAEINETAQYFVFYDMGASKTAAAVVSYQLQKDKQTKETHPVVQVLGVGYDRTLGGLDIQLRLRDYLAAEFNALKKTKTDVTKNGRALAKLFKEAGRVKNVLSANNDHYAQIENLLEDNDFKLQVTREKLEELCADLWPRVTKPLEQALNAAGLTLDVVQQVILFGGGTRMPKVQELLRQAIKQELGKSLNADEAATMGAVYKAADLATGFKVKKFIIKDAVLYPIQVSFERATEEVSGGGGNKQVKRVLFGLMNSYPQKKVITFNKHTEDFDFYVHYGDVTAEEKAFLGSLNITHVQLQQIKELLSQHKENLVDTKGIKAYFTLEDSGLFRCTGVEYVYEKEKVEVEATDESTLSKLGSTISKLFTKDGEQAEKKEDGASQSEKGTSEESGEAQEQEKQEKEQEKETVNAEKVNKTAGGEAGKNETIKLVTVKEPVQHILTLQFTSPLVGEAYEKSLEKLEAINTAETQRTRLESTFNALEAHVIDIQQKLQEDEYANCVTGAEKEKILNECSSISDWLYEDHENPTPEMYENRLKELKKLTNVFLARHWEHQERPDALKALDGMLDGARKFLGSASNLTKEQNPEKDIFTQVEIETLTKIIDETHKWKQTEVAAQKKLKRHNEVRLTVKEVTDKMAALDREVKYMVNKLKIWKPKVQPTKKSKKGKDPKGAKEQEEAGSGGTEEEIEAEQLEEPVEDGESNTTENNEVPEATPTPTPTEGNTPHSEL